MVVASFVVIVCAVVAGAGVVGGAEVVSFLGFLVALWLSEQWLLMGLQSLLSLWLLVVL